MQVAPAARISRDPLLTGGSVARIRRCGEPSKLQCPKCVEQGLAKAPYCSQECFKVGRATRSPHRARKRPPKEGTHRSAGSAMPRPGLVVRPLLPFAACCGAQDGSQARGRPGARTHTPRSHACWHAPRRRRRGAQPDGGQPRHAHGPLVVGAARMHSPTRSPRLLPLPRPALLHSLLCL